MTSEERIELLETQVLELQEIVLKSVGLIAKLTNHLTGGSIEVPDTWS